MNTINIKKILLLVALSIYLMPFSTTAQESSLKDIFEKKQQALKTLDINEVSKYMSSDLISAIKKEKDPKGVIFLMDYHSPREYQTGKESISGNTATMEIKGKARNPQLKGTIDTFNGVINYKKEGNVWKISSEDIKYSTKKTY